MLFFFAILERNRRNRKEKETKRQMHSQQKFSQQ